MQTCCMHGLDRTTQESVTHVTHPHILAVMHVTCVSCYNFQTPLLLEIYNICIHNFFSYLSQTYRARTMERN